MSVSSAYGKCAESLGELDQGPEMQLERVAIAADQPNRITHRHASVFPRELDDLQREFRQRGQHDLFVRAASTAGMSVSAFLLGTAQERARQILAEREMLTLSSRDWNAFAKALDNADKPKPKLSAAMQRHREWQQDQR